MDCQDFKNNFYKYIFSNLNEQEMELFEKHIAECERCSRAVSEISEKISHLTSKSDSDTSPEEKFPFPSKKSTKVNLFFKLLPIILLAIIFGTILFLSLKIGEKRVERKLISEIEKAIQIYKNIHNVYPPADGKLYFYLSNEKRCKQYLNLSNSRLNQQKQIVDRWGNPIVYIYPGKHNEGLYDIYSFGPNGKDDEGEKDDIANW